MAQASNAQGWTQLNSVSLVLPFPVGWDSLLYKWASEALVLQEYESVVAPGKTCVASANLYDKWECVLEEMWA